ncbi:MAG: glycosyltransferase family 9 protein [Bacteroidota bacterium]
MLTKGALALLRSVTRWRRVRPPGRGQIRSLLVVELSRMGDVVAALPALETLRAGFPSSSVIVGVQDRFAPLVRALLPGMSVMGLARTDAAGGMVRALLALRRTHPDLACNMSPGRRNALCVLSSGAPRMAGYLGWAEGMVPSLRRHPVEGRGIRVPTGLTSHMEPIGERALNVCRALGLDAPFRGGPYGVGPEAERPALLAMRAQGLPPLTPYAVVHPFAGWVHRAWPIQRYGDLAEALAAGGGIEVVLLCSPEERPLLRPLRIRFRGWHRVKFFAPEDLIHAAVLIRGASLFVGGDSGPLHLASALGVRAVALFGPAPPGLTAPALEPGSAIHYHKMACSPCDQDVCVRPQDSCMHQIHAEDVIASAVEVLGTRRSAPVPVHA